jgi:hypothetical protein
MNQVELAMNKAEKDILRLFRSYDVEADQMLFFHSGFAGSEPVQFSRAMQSMIQRGFVVQERRRGAYSLTTRGYRASLETS